MNCSGGLNEPHLLHRIWGSPPRPSIGNCIQHDYQQGVTEIPTNNYAQAP
jgi:hypothetical protein